MLDKILVPLDGSPLSDRIVGLLRRILTRKDAEVSLVEVVSPRPPGGADPKALMEESRRHLESVAAPLRAGGARVAIEVLAGDPADRLVGRALERPTSLIVMATHGRSGVQRFTRGSVAERVLRESPAPVLLANPFGLEDAKEMRFRMILVPLDGSQAAAAVLPLVREVARLYEAEVVLHHAIPITVIAEGAPPVLMTDEEARGLLRPFVSQLEGVRVELSTSVGDAASGALEACERKGCDLIAMTTHGRSGLSRWLMGSVAENVVRHARCPLLVVRTRGVTP